jgi:hypothetical protein
VRVHQVVGVVVLEELTAGERGGAVPVPVITEVPLVDHDADPAIATLVLLCDGHRAIGRTVVDDDELEVVECLAQHTLDGVGDVRLAVVRRHQHAGLRRAQHGFPVARRTAVRTAVTAAFGIH